MSEDLRRSIDLLSDLAQNPARLAELEDDTRIALIKAAGLLTRPGRDEVRRRHKAMVKIRRKKIKVQDRQNRADTQIRQARQATIFQAPAKLELSVGSEPGRHSEILSAGTLSAPKNCYVCKTEFTRLHFFYDGLCIPCADFNYQKRFQTAPLDGRVVLITGARLKIGYQSALMLLRAGARVIVTTRFPVDAALRFSKEADFQKWEGRLQIHGLDLRHTPSVEVFCRFILQTVDRLDFLINNAAQTVRRPTGFYTHLMKLEETPLAQLPPGVHNILQDREKCHRHLNALALPAQTPAQTVSTPSALQWTGQDTVPVNRVGAGITSSARLSQLPFSYDSALDSEKVFPKGKLDADLQQIDLRKNNSWRMKLAEVPAPEMLEVQLVNSVAPFVLCSQLAPLMRRDCTNEKHIVNVSAMEGKFHRYTKTDKHPHTNMAKAALNMMTLTSAPDLAKDGIFMNAVDTGWVTDEDPMELSKAKQDMHDFHPPLDIVDGAARVCDPIFHGILTGTHWSGKFLKDYKPTDW